MKRCTSFIRPVIETLEDRCIPTNGLDVNSLFGAFVAVEQSSALTSILVANAAPILSNPQLLNVAQGLLRQDAQRLVQADRAMKMGEQQASSSDPLFMYYSIIDLYINTYEYYDQLLGSVFGIDLTTIFQPGTTGGPSPTPISPPALPPSPLGNPVGSLTSLGVDNVYYQMYDKGAVVGTATQPLVEVKGNIFSRWQELGGINGPLSFPTSESYTIDNTTVQDFNDGWIVSNPIAGTMAVQGGTSHDLTALVSPAAMLGQGLSLNAGSSLGLWTPVVDDIKQLGGDLAHAAHGDPDVINMRYGPNYPPPPPLPATPPSPFHYFASLVNAPPTNPRLSAEQKDIYSNGSVEDIQYYSSTSPAASWLDSSGHFRSTVPLQAISQLDALAGSPGILIDPLFGAPIKFYLVDQIYDQSGNPLPQFAGVNESFSTYIVWTDGSIRPVAARVIEIKNWSDADPAAVQWAIHTMVHETGHSWDAYGLPTEGAINTSWILNNQHYFEEFRALSGWSLKPGADPYQVNSWTPTAGKDAFSPREPMPDGSYYSMTNPNEDWAETFELASEPGLVLSNYSPTLQAKIQLVKKFLDLTVLPSSTLGNAVYDNFVVYH